ncbi:putative metal-dependent hydrolase [Croceivirga lutea]|uniref:YfiT family bacillithiol transferase n=1 Tax=Croceivirga lutea TaxID=1775167 RepID=UPI001639C25F|nr:putative metal-dependent hydrolase [Croceivirga lutea]GGG49919.1 putative metal-dependent hydrolase [Croceivirga lutea]
MENLKYPIGKFYKPENITQQNIKSWIKEIEELPKKFEDLVGTLNNEQLETPYRPGGWTLRQLVHHVSDSHHNSYIRFKWALTEDTPVIKAYDEKQWANLFDTKSAPIDMSLLHLKAIHAKLVYLLKGLSSEQLKRTFIHPENNQETSLEENVGRYAWHGAHHYAHAKNLIERKGW